MNKVVRTAERDMVMDELDRLHPVEEYDFVTRSGTLYSLSPSRCGWVSDKEWGVIVPARLYREGEIYLPNVMSAVIPRDGGRALITGEGDAWVSTSPVVAWSQGSWCRTHNTSFWRGPNGHYEIPDSISTGKEILAYINK